MDFLKIRRKAKERATRAAAQAPGGSPAPGPGDLDRTPAAAPTPAGAVAERAPEPVPELPLEPSAARPAAVALPLPGRYPAETIEALRLEAELGRRISSLPPAADARFVSWRPDGDGLPESTAIRPIDEERSKPPGTLAWPLEPLDEFFYRPDEAAPGLGLVAAVAPGGELAAAVALEEYLLFSLAGETYGVEIGRVLEVLRSPQVTEVPRAPPDVRGVISVRGEVITLIDPRGRLALARAEGPPPRRVVIVDDGQGPCGLLVDGVAGVVRLPRGALEPCPQALGNAGGDLFLGIGRERDRLFPVIDLAALLRPLRRSVEGRPG